MSVAIVTGSAGLIGSESVSQYNYTNRIGDHIWYISDLTKFKNHFPKWNWKYNLNVTLEEIFNGQRSRV